ncbi:MAG: mannosyltransferase family protein, partial [Gaiellaceae bacterium]
GLYAVLSLALPLTVPSSRWPLLSLPRFGLVIFPLFLALATLGSRPRAYTAILGASAVFLGIVTVQWALWQWVS